MTGFGRATATVLVWEKQTRDLTGSRQLHLQHATTLGQGRSTGSSLGASTNGL